MDDASPAFFRPTHGQSVARGVYVGLVVALVGGTVGSVTTIAAVTLAGVTPPPGWMWLVLIAAPPLVGGLLGPPIRRRTGIEVGAGGIRTRSLFADGLAPWSRVVDLRAERRGGRTVVSVYLDSGASLQLHAPYSGELFAADPQFESKMFALSHLWRSHRFGGLAG